MSVRKEPDKFCRFLVKGKIYSGTVRGNMIDIVSGDPYSGYTDIRMSQPLDGAKLITPIQPNKVWCVGKNYRAHAMEFDEVIPEEPLIFMKPLTSVASHEEIVRMPAWAGRIDYEGELAVVIGKRCRKVSVEEALSCVVGYSCFNDVTARDLQKKDGQWTRAKSFDSFAPFGPFLLMTNELPPETEVITRLNGNVVQKAPISSMIFSVAQIISFISAFATLEPGDVIATGTPEGIGRISAGDRVEVEIAPIGKLSNPFIMEH